ncbi:MAG: ATP-binding cassette domain-containing protein [Steroidobacteraceae bacterium]|nr:ATP-binding cassette domain-containing protein [Steroidobacteraceae bacterium]
MNAPLLEVRGLSVTYRGDGREVRALRDCSLSVARGEVLALVGESGSGKSTCARAVAGLVAPDAGEIRFDGQDLHGTRGEAGRRLRRRVQMVFQDPDASLNPHHRVRAIVAEPLIVTDRAKGPALEARVRELLDLVHLDPALLERRPRELSGGQKQRVAIARALAAEPSLLIADESLSALDVSTQAVIAALFRELQQRLGLAMLFISHDLATVRRLAHRVAVLRDGALVDAGPASALDAPRHPYTRLLVAATPDPLRGGIDFERVAAAEAAARAPLDPVEAP